MSQELNDESTASPNPWASIWFQPRRTVRALIDAGSYRAVWVLAALSGVGWTLDQASDRGVGNFVSWPAIVGLSVVLGPLLGLIGLYFGAWLVFMTGSGLRGEALPKEIRATLAWSGLPYLVAHILYAPLVLLFGQATFGSELPMSEGDPRLLIVLGFYFAMILGWIWSLVLTIRGVAEAQRFGAWKGLANVVFAFMAFLVVGFIVGAMLFVGQGLMSGLMQSA